MRDDDPTATPHAALGDPPDFPGSRLGRTMTVDVEAKDTERAVLAPRAAIAGRLDAASTTTAPA